MSNLVSCLRADFDGSWSRLTWLRGLGCWFFLYIPLLPSNLDRDDCGVIPPALTGLQLRDFADSKGCVVGLWAELGLWDKSRAFLGGVGGAGRWSGDSVRMRTRFPTPEVPPENRRSVAMADTTCPSSVVSSNFLRRKRKTFFVSRRQTKKRHSAPHKENRHKAFLSWDRISSSFNSERKHPCG